jgi:hypothetical protein
VSERVAPVELLNRAVDPDTVRQGGGDVRLGHRCPGEDVTLTVLMVALRCLAGHPAVVVAQDLHWDRSRMPSRGFADPGAAAVDLYAATTRNAERPLRHEGGGAEPDPAGQRSVEVSFGMRIQPPR